MKNKLPFLLVLVGAVTAEPFPGTACAPNRSRRRRLDDPWSGPCSRCWCIVNHRSTPEDVDSVVAETVAAAEDVFQER